MLPAQGASMRDKKFFLPYQVEDEATRISMLRKGIEVTYYNFGKKKCLVAWVPNEDETIYHDFMRATWSDLKTKEEETRCLIPTANRKGFKTCHGSCRNCPKIRDRALESLDLAQELNGFEVADQCPDVFEQTTKAIVLFDLIEKLRKESPTLAVLIESILEHHSQEEIALAAGKSSSTINEQCQKAVKRLLELAKEN